MALWNFEHSRVVVAVRLEFPIVDIRFTGHWLRSDVTQIVRDISTSANRFLAYIWIPHTTSGNSCDSSLSVIL
jgi:hypothetical protein